ncbi:MAG: hypothetical protein IJC27_00165 [Lentisphaeria bacterium]|nr:hypothetical protein [Lentisphaeria bacterium]
MNIERSVGEKLKLDCYGKCESARICYVASGIGADEIDSAVVTVFESAPESWEDIPKHSAEILHSPGGGMLEIAVNYREENSSSSSRKSSSKSNGDREWRVDVHARQKQMRHARALAGAFAVNGVTVPNPGTLVNWNGRSGIGSSSTPVTAYEPEMILSCIATFRKSKTQSNSYLRQISNLVGKVNSERFQQWAAGELLFLGLSCGPVFKGKNGESLCDLTFRFSVRCNGTRTLDGFSTEVDGWDHLWGIYSVRNGVNILDNAYISRLYDRAPFSVLDL